MFTFGSILSLAGCVPFVILFSFAAEVTVALAGGQGGGRGGNLKLKRGRQIIFDDRDRESGPLTVKALLEAEGLAQPLLRDGRPLQGAATGGMVAVEGQTCTTPDMRKGRCSFINNFRCSIVVDQLANPSTRARALRFIYLALEPPCGYEKTDYTICCSSLPSFHVPPMPEVTSTAPSSRPQKQLDAECGLTSFRRIIGGSESDPGTWPWAVALGSPLSSSALKFAVLCGGTLITRRHVLTAAHCFASPGGRLFPTHARLGEHDLSVPSGSHHAVERKIESFSIHEQYSRVTFANDIAIVVLDGLVSYSTAIGPACLPINYGDVDLTTTQQPVVIGWGTTSNGGVGARVLREANTRVTAIAECKRAYSNVNRISVTDNMICAGDSTGDSCAGDSGGPLLSDSIDQRWSVIGIVSVGVKCASSTHPGIYTRVDRYLPWIYRVTGARSSRSRMKPVYSTRSSGNPVIFGR